MRLFGGEVPFYNLTNRAPDEGGGADDTATLDNDTGDVGGDDGGDVGDDGGAPADDSHETSAEGEGKPLSVREQLKKSIAEAQEADKEKAPKPKRGKQVGQKEAAAPKEAQAQQPAQTEDIPPPQSLPKELHEAWKQTPEPMRQAFLKREQDTARGVEELKQRYSLIDQAIAPHTDALRVMNASPGDAVNRMFLWFKALANSPEQAFPALIQSMGHDPARVFAALQGGQQQAAAGQPGQNPAKVPQLPDAVKGYVSGLEQQIQQMQQYIGQIGQRFGSVEQSMQAQNDARTAENLSIWSKDKEFFEDARQTMAELIQSGVVPLLPNGQVDLDTAYERAIYFNPEVRAKVLAKQQQANQQATQQQQEAATTARQQQVAKARRAGSSIPASSTPGTQVANSGAARGTGKSVRDSLREAMKSLREQ